MHWSSKYLYVGSSLFVSCKHTWVEEYWMNESWYVCVCVCVCFKFNRRSKDSSYGQQVSLIHVLPGWLSSCGCVMHCHGHREQTSVHSLFASSQNIFSYIQQSLCLVRLNIFSYMQLSWLAPGSGQSPGWNKIIAKGYMSKLKYASIEGICFIPKCFRVHS